MLSNDILFKEIDKMEYVIKKLNNLNKHVRTLEEYYNDNNGIYKFSLHYNTKYNYSTNETYDIELYNNNNDFTCEIALGIRMYNNPSVYLINSSSGTLTFEQHSKKHGMVYTLSGIVNSNNKMCSEEEYFLRSVEETLPNYEVYVYLFNFVKNISNENSYICLWFNVDNIFECWDEIYKLIEEI